MAHQLLLSGLSKKEKDPFQMCVSEQFQTSCIFSILPEQRRAWASWKSRNRVLKMCLRSLFFTPTLDHGRLRTLKRGFLLSGMQCQGVFHLPGNSRMVSGLSKSGHSGCIPTGASDVGEFCIYFSGINQVFWVCLWLL